MARKTTALVIILGFSVCFYLPVSFVFSTEEEIAPNESAVNQVLNLDGKTDYVRIANSPSLNSFSNAITMEVWLRASSFFEEDRYINSVIRKNVTRSSENFFLRFRTLDGKRHLAMSVSYDIPALLMPYDFALDTWYHLAGTYDGNAITIFINGVSAKSVKASGTMYLDNSDVFIGQGDPGFCDGEHFHGSLDEIRIWSIARSPEEIRANMNKTLTGKEGGLVVYLNFDDGTAKDLSPNGNDGLLGENTRIIESPFPVSTAPPVQKADELAARPTEAIAAKPQDRSRPVSKKGIEGDWQIVSDQLSQKAIIEIRREPDGSLTAAVVADDASQTPGIMLLDEVTFESGKLWFEMKSNKGVFEGTMKEDGLTIEGQFRQQGKMMSLILKRVDATQSEVAQEVTKITPAQASDKQLGNSGVSGESNMMITLILVLGLAGVIGRIVFFLVKSSIVR